MSVIARLQRWYLSNCNDDWEHSWGVKIGTLDNPGWWFKINLDETPLQDARFEGVRIDRTEHDWVYLNRIENRIEGACGPENLEEALEMFCDWADRTKLGL